MLDVVSREPESVEQEQYSMRFQDHPAVQRRDMFQVDPRKLKVDPEYNARAMDSKETREHIAGLKASIIANGVKVPLEVRLGERDQIFIVAGHCRQIAVMEAIKDGAEIAAVPCVLESKGTSEVDRTVNLIISNSGKPLAPLEVAAVVKRLDAYGWSAKQIAERLGWKSTNTVKQHLDMVGMKEDLKARVNRGEVSATTARNIAKGVDPELAEKLFRENEEENKRIRGTGKRERKVTPRAVKKATEAAKPKAEPRESKNETVTEAPAVVGSTATPLSGIATDRPTMEVGGADRVAPHLAIAEPEPRTEPLPSALAAPQNQTIPRHGVKDLIEALEPFANLAHSHDFNERGDDETVEVVFKHLKKAWVVFAAATGATESEAA